MDAMLGRPCICEVYAEVYADQDARYYEWWERNSGLRLMKRLY
jgi:hypothetical protein